MDPLFASIDGVNCPGVVPRDGAAPSLISRHGLIRIPIPAAAEFSLSVVRDPTGCILTVDAAMGRLSAPVGSATTAGNERRRPRRVAPPPDPPVYGAPRDVELCRCREHALPQRLRVAQEGADVALAIRRRVPRRLIGRAKNLLTPRELTETQARPGPQLPDRGGRALVGGKVGGHDFVDVDALSNDIEALSPRGNGACSDLERKDESILSGANEALVGR